MDFRRIDPAQAFAVGTKKSRNLYPFLPRVPVQIPRASIVVTLGSFAYNAVLGLDTRHAAHAAFVEWVDGVESAACEAVARLEPALQWTTSIKGFGQRRSMYLSIEDSTVVFDGRGQVLQRSPCTISAGDVLAEIAGVWTGPTNAGLRWKVAQLKENDPWPAPPAVSAFLADADADADEDLRPAKRRAAFIEEDDA